MHARNDILKCHFSKLRSLLLILLIGTTLAGFLCGAGPLGAYLIGINITGFAAMAFDKTSAVKGALRIPERALHFLALLGATPAILLALPLIRHKTKDSKFKFFLVVILFAQLWLLYQRPQFRAAVWDSFPGGEQ